MEMYTLFRMEGLIVCNLTIAAVKIYMYVLQRQRYNIIDCIDILVVLSICLENSVKNRHGVKASNVVTSSKQNSRQLSPSIYKILHVS